MLPPGMSKRYLMKQFSIEMERWYIDIIGVSETHWTNETRETFQKEQHLIIHS